MIGAVDPLVQTTALLAIVSIFIRYLVKTGSRRTKERIESEKSHSEERAVVAKERIAVQENFKDYLTSQSTAWTKTQSRIAESLNLLSTEIRVMSTRNTTEHGELLEWVRTQKKTTRK